MPRLRVFTAAEQVATHLRRELVQGTWRGEMPGSDWLAKDLGVGHNTIEGALALLEKEGLLVSQGAGRRRRIEVQEGELQAPPLRFAILDYDPPAKSEAYMIELRHRLIDAGHTAFFTERSLIELHMDVQAISRLVNKTDADAWVVGSGSRKVLEWFAEQPVPAFAFFGRRRGLPIAGVGPDKPPAVAAATRALIDLGHHRIVMMVRRDRRLPEPGANERAFLEELVAHGIQPGAYNLPDWEETIGGFHACLEALFRISPPGALMVDEAPLLTAALQFCANRGLRVPQDISLICTDPNPTFAWCRPSIAHIHWDSAPVLRRILRWADNVARSKNDRRQTLTKAEFVQGGTIGPVPKLSASSPIVAG